MMFFVLLTLGFIFELGKNALTIESRQTSYSNIDLSTAHSFISGPYSLDNGLSLSTSEDSKVDPTIYIKIEDEDGLKFVPVTIKGTSEFIPDLSQNIHRGNPIPNNEKDSLLATEKARLIFEQSELCACSL
jgi:hypothetical protein